LLGTPVIVIGTNQQIATSQNHFLTSLQRMFRSSQRRETNTNTNVKFKYKKWLYAISFKLIAFLPCQLLLLTVHFFLLITKYSLLFSTLPTAHFFLPTATANCRLFHYHLPSKIQHRAPSIQHHFNFRFAPSTKRYPTFKISS